jgi:hypothetical protein
MVIGSDGHASTSFPDGPAKLFRGAKKDVIVATVRQTIVMASFFMFSFPFTF